MLNLLLQIRTDNPWTHTHTHTNPEKQWGPHLCVPRGGGLFRAGDGRGVSAGRGELGTLPRGQPALAECGGVRLGAGGVAALAGGRGNTVKVALRVLLLFLRHREVTDGSFSADLACSRIIRSRCLQHQRCRRNQGQTSKGACVFQ